MISYNYQNSPFSAQTTMFKEYLSNLFSKEFCYYISTKKREKSSVLTKRLMIIWGLFTVDYPVEIED